MTTASHLAELERIIAARPVEPFTDKTKFKRRPNNYRDTPEYRNWRTAAKNHNGAVNRWFQQGLGVIRNEHDSASTLYGDIIHGAHFHKRDNGVFVWESLTLNPWRDEILDAANLPLDDSFQDGFPRRGRRRRRHLLRRLRGMAALPGPQRHPGTDLRRPPQPRNRAGLHRRTPTAQRTPSPTRQRTTSPGCSPPPLPS